MKQIKKASCSWYCKPKQEAFEELRRNYLLLVEAVLLVRWIKVSISQSYVNLDVLVGVLFDNLRLGPSGFWPIVSSVANLESGTLRP